MRARLFERGRFATIYQNTTTECGLACIAMVATFHGGPASLQEVRELVSTSARGMSMRHLVAAGQTLGLNARPLKLGVASLKLLRLPCILHWEFDHYVVLRSVSSSRFEIDDPAVGRRRMSIDEVRKSYTGVALELTPGASFVKRPQEPTVSLWNLIGKVTGLRRALMTLLVIGFALELTVIVMPFYLQWAIDYGIGGRDFELLTKLGFGFALVAVINGMLIAIRGWAITSLSSEFNFQWMFNTFSHILKLPLQYFERRSLGAISSSFEAIILLQRAITTSLVESFVDGIFVVGILAVMISYSLAYSAISMGAIVIYVAVRLAGYQPLIGTYQNLVLSASKQRTSFLETIRGISTLRLYNKESERAVIWSNLLVDQLNADIGGQRILTISKSIQFFVLNLERIAVVWVASTALVSGQFSLGMLVAFLAFREQFIQRCVSIVDKGVEWRLLRVQTARLSDIIDTDAERDGQWRTEVDSAKASIVFDRVSFCYGANERKAVSDLSFTINNGECVAIVGPSGAGKTTVGKLLVGLLAPTSGSIAIGGIEIASISKSQLRSMFGTVLHEDGFFAGSIFDNISFFDSTSDDGRVFEASRLCQVHDEILALPMGYNTQVGDIGSIISAGQKQRILLARALYKQPKFLLLDEATSHLDAANESLIGRAIADLRMTRIVIAHRSETIALCDRVIRL